MASPSLLCNLLEIVSVYNVFVSGVFGTIYATGDTHTKVAEKLEAGDAKAEDPYSLPTERGLKSYTVAWNTWSIDGLPGVRQVAERMPTKETIRKKMIEEGIPAEELAIRLSNDRQQWVLLVLFGLILGVVLTVCVQNGVHVLRGTWFVAN